MSKPKQKSIRLANNANDAFRILADTTYKRRVVELENINEFSFALLIYWNRVEIALKLGSYYQKTEDTFPTKLDFIDKRKTFIKNLYHINPTCFDCVLEGVNSIWKIRNKIAHASFQIMKSDYDKYKVQILLFEKNIKGLIPERNAFLTKKKSVRNLK